MSLKDWYQRTDFQIEVTIKNKPASELRADTQNRSQLSSSEHDNPSYPAGLCPRLWLGWVTWELDVHRTAVGSTPEAAEPPGSHSMSPWGSSSHKESQARSHTRTWQICQCYMQIMAPQHFVDHFRISWGVKFGTSSKPLGLSTVFISLVLHF